MIFICILMFRCSRDSLLVMCAPRLRTVVPWRLFKMVITFKFQAQTAKVCLLNAQRFAKVLTAGNALTGKVGELSLLISEEELKQRRVRWKAPAFKVLCARFYVPCLIISHIFLVFAENLWRVGEVHSHSEVSF